jgi:transposase-like protein
MLRAEETRESGKSISYVVRQHNVSPSQIFKWRPQYEEGALTDVGSEEKVVPESGYKQALERIRRLERLLGQKTEEVDILKKRYVLGVKKNRFGAIPISGWELFHEQIMSCFRCFSFKPLCLTTGKDSVNAKKNGERRRLAAVISYQRNYR